MNLDHILNIFRAVGEETRLRIMVVLIRGEMTVSELTQILGQSQPRVSRHLKILADAALVERYREGSWMFYRAVAGGVGGGVAAVLAALSDLADTQDRLIARDRDRFDQSRQARASAAAAYFEANAAEWDTVRRLHLPESDIESEMRALVGDDRVDSFIDLGTGTGRMLTLFADAYRSGIGFDLSREMLSVARANLDKEGVAHAQVRHGDLFSLPPESSSADIVCLHQVLHFLVEPGNAVREAARLLKPGGKLLISDFAPHELEFLRQEHAHRRLGFSDQEVRGWCAASNLVLEKTSTLSPNSAEVDVLTVKIWLCRVPVSVTRMNKRSKVA